MLQAAAGEPLRIAPGIVIAAVAALAVGRAAELRRPDDERVIEQAARLEIGEQAGDRLVDRARMGAVVLFELAMRVPVASSPWPRPSIGPDTTWMKRTPRSTRRRARSSTVPIVAASRRRRGRRAPWWRRSPWRDRRLPARSPPCDRRDHRNACARRARCRPDARLRESRSASSVDRDSRAAAAGRSAPAAPDAGSAARRGGTPCPDRPPAGIPSSN